MLAGCSRDDARRAASVAIRLASRNATGHDRERKTGCIRTDRFFLYIQVEVHKISKRKRRPRRPGPETNDGRRRARAAATVTSLPLGPRRQPAQCRYRSTRPVLWSRADGPRVIFLLSRGRVRGGDGETRPSVLAALCSRSSCTAGKLLRNGNANQRPRASRSRRLDRAGVPRGVPGGGDQDGEGGKLPRRNGTKRNRSARKEQLAGARHRGGHGGGAEQSRQIQRRHHPLARPRRAKE